MTDKTGDSDRAVAAFMSRVAEAHGLNDPAPDPTWLWLKARLEQRLEREERASNARNLSLELVLIALGFSAFVAVRWTWPLLAELGDMALLTGASVAAVVPLIWFLGVRPLRDER